MLLSSNVLIQHPEMHYSFGQWLETESRIFLNRLFSRLVYDEYIRILEQVDSICEMGYSEFYALNKDAIVAFKHEFY